MKTVEHNGSTTGFYHIDERTGVYFTMAQPNGGFVHRLVVAVVAPVLHGMKKLLRRK